MNWKFEAFYGMSRTPFARVIDTQELYVPVMLEEVLGCLVYAAQRQLFAVMTGDCGIRAFKNQGGYNRINKVFRDKRDTIITDINQYLFEDGGQTA